MILSPCKDCADRCYLCHSKCERYNSYKRALEIEKESCRKYTEYSCYRKEKYFRLSKICQHPRKNTVVGS